MASNYVFPEPQSEIYEEDVNSDPIANRARIVEVSHHSHATSSSDISLDDLFELTGDFVFQQSSPVTIATMPAPTQSQPRFDPPTTPFYSYGYLETLIPRMKTSEQSRSKVNRMLLSRQQPMSHFASKLAATGLDTTKSEETRNRLLQANYLGGGQGTPMNLTPSSGNAGNSILDAGIQPARRQNSSRSLKPKAAELFFTSSYQPQRM